jgi:GAF domain-containing protein/methyl-accepting chemotaxis protein
MDISLNSNSFLDRLLKKTGGNYIIFAVVFSQVAASIGTLLGFISEQLNSHYTPEIVAVLRKIEIVVIPAVTISLIAIVYIITRNMRAYLDEWKQNPDVVKNEDNEKAWKDSQNIIWKYAIAATLVSFGLIIIPKTILLGSTSFATQDQVIYSLISGLVSNFAFIPFSTIILDRLLVPTRRILLPNNLSKQFSGLSNIKILYKTLAVIFFSLLITALLIAPIGYHQTTRVIYESTDPQEVLLDLQIQSVLVSALAIFFASSLAFLLARSIADPMASLMESFKQVEQGNLDTRAPVVSSDEISQLAIYFNRMVARLQELQSELENKVDERTSQLKAINEVSRVATSILDPDDLLSRVANLIVEEFGYYYSAIYLLDQSGAWADLKAATGGTGQVFLESGRRVEVTNANVIGTAIRSRKAQVLVDVGEKAVKFEVPLLPYTRTELVLPLMVGDQVLGALDVHSSKEAAFSEQDIETLQNMANQVSISLDNARLFQETHQSLNEMRNIQKQYLREAWIDSNLPQDGVTLAIGDETNIDNPNSVQVPITLREQIIGQLKLEGDEPLSAEEENWIQAIAAQTALALENARLLEESQSIAMREKFVTEITNKIWASTSMDGVLQTAVRELGQILDATEATIELDVK